jgi:glycosyltransferase involved in cell wall biosynthesis
MLFYARELAKLIKLKTGQKKCLNFDPKLKVNLKVAINTRLLLHNKLEGIGRFSFEIMKRITEAHPEHEFIYLFDRPFHESFITSKNITPLVLFPPTRHPVLWKLWFDWSIPFALKKHKVDLFISPDGFLSHRLNIPQLAVIHDLNFEAHPEDLRKSHSKYYRKEFPQFAKIAARIATVSEFSRQDIAERYHVPLSEIDVINNAVSKSFKPSSRGEISRFKAIYTAGCNYFLFVGALHPRKNIERLLKAFDLCKTEKPGSYKLLLAGQKYWWNEQVEETYEHLNHKKDVIFTGRLKDEELRIALNGALALTFVPYFEGFGIPILEAFACKCPVITSNITAMPEVAGDAALLVNPFSVNEIAKAMMQIEENAEMRKNLASLGMSQLQKFSWDKSAIDFWKCIEKTIEKA